jgi:hypothetical protein
VGQATERINVGLVSDDYFSVLRQENAELAGHVRRLVDSPEVLRGKDQPSRPG